MAQTSFTGLAIVAAVAFLVPLLLELVPGLPIPAGVLELVVGIVIGPAVLGWVGVDDPIRVLGAIGLGYLLFLAGLEVDAAHLRGGTLKTAGLAFGISVVLAAAVGYALDAAGLVGDGGLVAVILSASYLGAIATILADAGEVGTPLGSLTIAGAAIANVAAVLLLGLVFTGGSAGAGARAVLLLGFAALAAAIAAGVCGLERSRRLSAALLRLQDSSAQIRVRGAFLLLAGVLALAGRLGLEVLLVAFTAGAVLGLVDRDTMRTHPQLRTKLEGAGFGFFIPVFMVASGLQFDLDALLAGPRTLALAPIALVAIVLVRAVPAAVVHRRALGARAAAASGLLLATSLPFIVAATQIGVAVGALSRGTSAALIAAGVLSLTIMPPAARMLLAGGASRGAAPALRRPVPTTPPTGG
jgi:Kef-type K+ transport system membrane component KefB